MRASVLNRTQVSCAIQQVGTLFLLLSCGTEYALYEPILDLQSLHLNASFVVLQLQYLL